MFFWDFLTTRWFPFLPFWAVVTGLGIYWIHHRNLRDRWMILGWCCAIVIATWERWLVAESSSWIESWIESLVWGLGKLLFFRFPLSLGEWFNFLMLWGDLLFPLFLSLFPLTLLLLTSISRRVRWGGVVIGGGLLMQIMFPHGGLYGYGWFLPGLWGMTWLGSHLVERKGYPFHVAAISGVLMTWLATELWWMYLAPAIVWLADWQWYSIDWVRLWLFPMVILTAFAPLLWASHVVMRMRYKQCPACAERIKTAARRCRYCQFEQP